MKHTVISKRRGWYTAFPQLYSMPDGRQTVGVPASPFSDHFHVDRRSQFLVFESRDGRGVVAGVRRPRDSLQLARPEPPRKVRPFRRCHARRVVPVRRVGGLAGMARPAPQ